MPPLTIESTRGEGAESVHRVSAVVVDAKGAVVAHSGDIEFPTFLRSAAKPFQAIPAVADGAADQFAVTPEELAVACASHNSERRHVALARALLARVGCTEQDLACGPHRSLAIDLGVRLPGEPLPGDLEAPGRLASNCSGKHTLMLALARAQGWPVAGYNRPDHPVQQRIREEVARWSGLDQAAIREGSDGCGVVSFCLPLRAMALAFGRFGVSDDAAAARVRAAMLAHPELVAGRQRLCTTVMQVYPGQVIAKVGADGVYGVALPQRGLGLALKVEDGDNRSAMVALIAILTQLGFDTDPRDQLARFASFPVLDTRGETIGTLRARGSLTFA
ncbi:MAG: asparaginase [Gemmatimonadota bacterium]|nr:asparaginase [Gemmatimonadota bacterium]